jgi:hypothetical protein
VRAARGFDSIVYRGGTTGIRLAKADGRADDVPPGAVPVTEAGADHLPKVGCLTTDRGSVGRRDRV